MEIESCIKCKVCGMIPHRSSLRNVFLDVVCPYCKEEVANASI